MKLSAIWINTSEGSVSLLIISGLSSPFPDFSHDTKPIISTDKRKIIFFICDHINGKQNPVMGSIASRFMPKVWSIISHSVIFPKTECKFMLFL